MNVIRRGIAAGGIVAAISLSGCEPQAQLKVRPLEKTVTQAPGVDASLDAVAPETSALAAQSQRDVEAILKSRSTPPTLDADPASPQPHATTNPPRKTIVWNDPNAPAKPGTTDIIQPALARPTDVPASTQPAQTLATEGAPAAAPNLAPDRLKSLMVDLSKELYASGSYSQTPLRELLMIAAMSMVDPQRMIEPHAVPDLTEKERELLGKLQAFFAQLGQSLDGKADTEQAIVEAVAKLRETLVQQPTLRLTTATLCTRVGGFGDYSAFEKNTFLAQSQQKAIVYLEIADFTSELNQKNEYVTQIAQQLTIYSDRDGIPVWKEDWQTAVDVTKNKRQDFFTVQVITLPKALSVGRYQLKIRARDEKSRAEAEASIPFEMVADPRMVGK